MNETKRTEEADPQKSSDSAPQYELTAFQQNIICILSEEPMYGLAIKRRLESYYSKEVNHGRLYPNLDELVGMGLITKSELDKRTNEYDLTADGRTYLNNRLAWMGQHVDGHRLSGAEPATQPARTDGGDEQ